MARSLHQKTNQLFEQLKYIGGLATYGLAALLLAACGGGGSDDTQPIPTTFTVGTSAGTGGSINPTSAIVNNGAITSFTVTPNAGYSINSVSGCGGSLSGNTYTTGAITSDCTVSASFSINTYTVTASASTGGSISPTSTTVNHGTTTSFTVTPDTMYAIDTVTGCGGSLNGNTYTTGVITADCVVSASFAGPAVMSVADNSVIEGNGGSAALTFTISLSVQANGNVTVDYATSDGTAIGGVSCGGGVDYITAGGALTISSGTTSTTLDVTVCGDTDYESNETFTVALSNVSANATFGTATATGSIANDDAGGLNDTGITGCYDPSTSTFGTVCPQATHPGQDAEYGRDSNPLINSDADGHAGFSFTKLDASGNPLAVQSVAYASTPWSCVRDNVTGLIWEVKTDDGGLHDKDWTYTWYNSNFATNGGSPGAAAGGSCGGTVAAGCDTEKFVAAVNAAGLCGHADWRLPSAHELASLMNSSITSPGPTIDTLLFPNTPGESFASSSPAAYSADSAWTVGFRDGSVGVFIKNFPYQVRLVRAGQ